MKEHFVRQYLNLNSRVRAAAHALLCRIHIADPKEANPKYLEFVGVDDDGDMYFDGNEYWGYGGHEHHTYRLHISYLFDDAAFAQYIDNIVLKRKKREETENAEKRRTQFMAETARISAEEYEQFKAWKKGQQ